MLPPQLVCVLWCPPAPNACAMHSPHGIACICCGHPGFHVLKSADPKRRCLPFTSAASSPRHTPLDGPTPLCCAGCRPCARGASATPSWLPSSRWGRRARCGALAEAGVFSVRTFRTPRCRPPGLLPDRPTCGCVNAVAPSLHPCRTLWTCTASSCAIASSSSTSASPTRRAHAGGVSRRCRRFRRRFPRLRRLCGTAGFAQPPASHP